jgi:hypothetical protein
MSYGSASDIGSFRCPLTNIFGPKIESLALPALLCFIAGANPSVSMSRVRTLPLTVLPLRRSPLSLGIQVPTFRT